MPKSHTVDRENGVSFRNKSHRKRGLSPNQKRKIFKRDMKKRDEKPRTLCAENKFFEQNNHEHDEEVTVLNWNWDDYLRPCKEGCMCWEFCASTWYEYECDCW